MEFETFLDGDTRLELPPKQIRGSFRSISVSRREAWSNVLQSLGGFDFHHTADFHRLESDRDPGGQAELMIYAEHQHMIAVPLIVRSIDVSDPDSSDMISLFDARSVYGYVGWLASAGIPGGMLSRFGATLGSYLHARGIVSVFGRLHPLESTRFPEPCVGDVTVAGKTVAIDLAQGLPAYEAGLAKGHRHEIRKLRESGCVVAREDANLREFAELYAETMVRLGASSRHRYNEDYLRRFCATTQYGTRIYSARQAGRLAAMAMFVRTGDIVQYHLSASREGVTRFPATKLIIDQAVRDALAEGARWMHLGGGVGSREDSLFTFKRGFGGDVMPFKIWRWVVRPRDYRSLTRLAEKDMNTDFFPAYRG